MRIKNLNDKHPHGTKESIEIAFEGHLNSMDPAYVRWLNDLPTLSHGEYREIYGTDAD